MDSDLIRTAYSSVTSEGGGVLASRAVKELLRRLINAPNFGGVRAEAHPLGFLCFRWSISDEQTLRLHLWSNDFGWRQNPDWQIHDHIFGFESVVVLGKLLNKCYQAAPLNQSSKRQWPIYQVTYNTGQSSLTESGKAVHMKVVSTQIVCATETYRIDASVLHRTKLISPKAITLVAASNAPKVVSPRVVGSGKESELSFGRSTISIDVPAIVLAFSNLMDLP